MPVQKYRSLNINFFVLGASAALFRFTVFPAAEELSIRDDSGGGEDRGTVKTGGCGSEDGAGAAGALEGSPVGFDSGIVDARVILGIVGAPGAAVGAWESRGMKRLVILRCSRLAARRRVASLVSRGSLSSLGIE